MYEIGPSFLLHPLDFLGPEDAKELSFFPGMKLAVERKIETAHHIFSLLKKNFTVSSLNGYAKTIAREARSRCKEVNV